MFLFKVQSGSDSQDVRGERSGVNAGCFHGFDQSVSLSHALTSESLHEAYSTRVLHQLGEFLRQLLNALEEISSCRLGVFGKFIFLNQFVLGRSQMDADGVTEVGVVMSHWRGHLGLGSVVEATGVHLLREGHEVGW